MNLETHQQQLDNYYRKQVGGRSVLWKDKYKPYLSLYRDRLIVRNSNIERSLPANLETAIDVGCGQGDLLVMLADKARRVIGVDYSNVMVETTRRNLSDFPNVSVHCAPAEVLPFSDGEADVIILADVIEHLVEPEKSIKECWRVLKPNGRLIITTPNAVIETFWKRFDGALNAPFRWLRRKRPPQLEVLEHLYNREALQELAVSAPFRILKHTRIEFYPGSEGAGVFGRLLRWFARERHVREWLIEPVFRTLFAQIERCQVFNNRQLLVLEKVAKN